MRLLAALLLTLASAFAQTPERATLESFVDGVVTTAMEDHRIPGVIVSVVQAGEVILLKGYGHAREPERVAADPRKSLFRVASISKTFNATALMKLVEEGRVDLEADFTQYLPGIRFNLPLGRVRVRDLLTHSAGFEDSYLGHFWAIDMASDHTLEHYVAHFQPAQVRPPGERLVYSNYGTSVIGLIVQRVSGMRYAEYLQRHVLAPLGMVRSGFREADTTQAEKELAWSYNWRGGRFLRPRWAWLHAGTQPVGGLLTTAEEMTHFMRAHLGNGAGVIKPETVARMHQPLLSNHPFVNRNAHGFWLGSIWGYNALQHGGSIFGFMSNLVLVPELGLGIFISTNASSGSRLSSTLPRRIIGQFWPKRIKIPAPDPKAKLDHYAGEYRPQRRGYTTVEKATALANVVTITANDQGYLVMGSGTGQSRYVPLGGDRFLNPDTGERLAFTRDAGGHPGLLHLDGGSNNLDRVGVWDAPGLVWILTGALAFALLARLMALWLYRRERPVEGRAEWLARHGTTVLAVVWPIFGYALYRELQASEEPISTLFARYPANWTWVWVATGLLGAGVTALLVAALGPVWFQRSWSVPRRLAYSAYVLLSALFVVVLHTWNLLGLHTLG